jgi:hypothetical protein
LPETYSAAVGFVFQGHAGEDAARALLLLFCHRDLSGRAALVAAANASSLRLF